MKIETLKPMVKSENEILNPFTQDMYHMGTNIGSNVVVMMKNHVEEECKYLIVVDCKTGERVKISFE